MTKFIITAAMGWLLVSIYKAKKADLRYFSPEDFGVWFFLIDTELLIKLDEFRHRLGYPVYISPVDGALGRLGDSASQHYPAPFVKAVDIQTDAPLERVEEIAIEVGFTGIGLYPDWQPRQGAHLDVRKAENGHIAKWSARYVMKNDNERVQEYFNIERAYT